MVSNRHKILAIAAAVVCAIAFGAALEYTLFMKPDVYAVYFDPSSDLSANITALKREMAGGKEGPSLLEVDRDYRVAFTVQSESAKPERYSYVMDWGARRQEESFSLGPTENRTFYVTITPTEDDLEGLTSEEDESNGVLVSKPMLLTVTVYRERENLTIPSQPQKTKSHNPIVYDTYRESKPPTIGFWYQVRL